MSVDLWDKKSIIEKYLKLENSSLSTYSFVNLFAWSEFFNFKIEQIQDCLCIFASNELGCFLFLPPLGGNVGSSVVEECFRRMESHNEGSNVARIESAGRRHLHHISLSKYQTFKKNYEYLYYKDDIVSLSGKAYKSKRSSYNNFVSNNQFSFIDFDSTLLNQCLALYDVWAEGRSSEDGQEVSDQMLDECRSVNRLLLKNCCKLNLIAKVVLVEGKVEAFTIGYEITEDVFCIFSEIANLEITGLPIFIFNALCKDEALKQYKFINVMDDFEMENMTTTKMSFRPAVMLDSYSISLK